MNEAKRYRLLHVTPSHQIEPERDVNLLRGTIVLTEAEHGRAIDALAAEGAELDQLRNRLSSLLSETAVALRGPEPELTRYGYADIPARVKAVVDRLAELERDAARWISVEERLPDQHKAEYLCLFDGGHQQVSEWIHDETDGWVFWYGDPTHWMPLPAAPSLATEAERDTSRGM